MIRLNLADNTATLRLEDEQFPCRVVPIEPGVLDIELPQAEDNGTIRLGGHIFKRTGTGGWKQIAGQPGRRALTAEQREVRDAEIQRRLERGDRQAEVARALDLPRDTVCRVAMRMREAS